MKQVNFILKKSNYFYCSLKGIKNFLLFVCLLVSHKMMSRNEEVCRKNRVTILLPLLPLIAEGETSLDFLETLEPVGHQNLL